jgi:hypothetical protein
MKLLYNGETIMAAVYDADWFRFRHSINVPLATLEIDEVGDGNKAVCQDLYRNCHKRDVDGLGKYYVESGELHVRDGWKEYVQS